jgi:hypothetical protein
MAIEEAIDQVKIARAATACAHGKLACNMSVRSCGERGYLFVSDMKPLDLLASPDDVGESVQGVADNAVNPLYASLHQCFDEYLRHLLRHDFFSLLRARYSLMVSLIRR